MAKQNLPPTVPVAQKPVSAPSPAVKPTVASKVPQDHVAPAHNAHTMRETWARQTANVREMRLKQLAARDPDVKALMDELANLKAEKTP